jgi:hypothetical protein
VRIIVGSFQEEVQVDYDDDDDVFIFNIVGDCVDILLLLLLRF